jgi:hypothetical protein
MPKRFVETQGDGDAVALAAPLWPAHATARPFDPGLSRSKTVVANICKIIVGCLAGIEAYGQSLGPNGLNNSARACALPARFDANLVPDSGG